MSDSSISVDQDLTETQNENPNQDRHYYISNDAKTIIYYDQKQSDSSRDLEGYAYCGMSQMSVKAAAGYYARNQSGFTIKNGDQQTSEVGEEETNDVDNKT